MLYAYYSYRHFYFLAPALDYTVDSLRPLYYFVPVCYFEISPEATSTCAEDLDILNCRCFCSSVEISISKQSNVSASLEYLS
jgi:hypothetical protein